MVGSPLLGTITTELEGTVFPAATKEVSPVVGL